MTSAAQEAYPLSWPVGRTRVAYRQTSKFKIELGRSIREVQREVDLLGGSGLVISSNLPVRSDGMPYARAAEPRDPGVAVYLSLKKRPMCFACDRWDRIRDNLHAIALTIGALRGIERWGSGQMVEQAFTGFTALPAPEQWFTILGVSANATRDQIESAYRTLAMKHHPDRPGGNAGEMSRINTARDEGLART